MKINTLCCAIILFSFCCFGQAGEWVWIHGTNISNHPGVFGTKGVPDSTNMPPSLYEACEWTDHNGNFWLFGGVHIGADYGDLWRYTPATNEWTWMNGAGVPGAPAVYGTQGVPSPLNRPPASWGGINSWTDLNGNLWLFGGGGSATGGGYCSDLWMYNISTNEWIWVKGPGTYNSPGYYGIKGVPNILNNPPSRCETAASWTDDNGDLWMFGGITSGNNNELNDLWRYNIATNTWTWIKGLNIPNAAGYYGVQGVEDSLNTPGARKVYCRWKDNNGNLWLYGGNYFSDLWKFNVSTNNWSWVNGDSTKFSPDNYGTECFIDDQNKAGMRFENRAAWKDTNGNLWMFGGSGGNWNDLWVYNIGSNKWMLANQDSLNQGGVWGTKGVSSPTNIPSGSWGSIGWTDNNGQLYLFGGALGTNLWYNALWKFTIDTTCNFPLFLENIDNKESFFTISPNPNNGTFSISIDVNVFQHKSDLNIYNLQGNKIYQRRIYNSIENIQCDIIPGVYIVKLINEKFVYSTKMIVVGN